MPCGGDRDADRWLLLRARPLPGLGAGEAELTHHATAPGWGLAFCRSCGTTLCGTHDGQVHGVTLGSVDGDPGVELEWHQFVGSRAPWDHVGGDSPRYLEAPPDGD